MSDLHGSKDITSEHQGNVILQKQKTITGSSFNNILLSLFALNCNSAPSKFFPGGGGRESWKILEESLCVMLLTFSTVDHILHRLFHLILCDCFGTSFDSRSALLAEGALSFISHWTTKFWRYISLQNFNCLMQLLDEFLSQLLLLQLNETASTAGSAQHYAGLVRRCIESCSSRYIQGSAVPTIKSAALGTWDKTAEKTCVFDGTLESIQQRKVVGMRKTSDKHPPVIAIFGVTQDVLDLSDDDCDDEGTCYSSMNYETCATPESRVPEGYNLLQDYHNVNIWDFDVREIARQWTLMDHSLFRAIPLTNLQCCRWTDPRHETEANEVRRFIDRFNAESCWVTQSLLNQDTPRKRAALYMKFIFLANHLEELNNFNGLMAVLTAVQQGCITRLSETISYVDEKTKQSLKRLQILMSGSMNYIKYREYIITVLHKKEISIVPHLGAHLAEICSIEEGNTSYMLGAAHLLNVEKLQLFARCFLQIGMMQDRLYDFQQTKLIQVSLLSELRQCQFMSSSSAAQWSKDMYNKSLLLDGLGVLSQSNCDDSKVCHPEDDKMKSDSKVLTKGVDVSTVAGSETDVHKGSLGITSSVNIGSNFGKGFPHASGVMRSSLL